MRNLHKRLEEWCQQGLISAEQVGQISQYEHKRPVYSWFFTSFLLLGISVLFIGLVSLIAANWHLIPGYIKLFADFLILILLAGRIFYFERGWRFEIGLFTFVALCLVSIGLISQVYQLQGDLADALLFWALITFPIVVFADKPVLPFLWVVNFLLTLTFKLVTLPFLEKFYLANELWLIITGALPLFCILIVVVFQQLKSLTWIVHSFRVCAVLAGLIALAMIDLSIAIDSKFLGRQILQQAISALTPVYVLAGFVILAIFLSKIYSSVNKVLLTLLLILYLVMLQIALSKFDSEILAAVLTITALSLSALHFGSTRQQFLFNLMTLLIVFRFLIAYLTEIASLMHMGFAFMTTGTLIIALVYLWQKNRKKVQLWLEALNT